MTQPSIEVILALLLAHVLGDFPFQTTRMVKAKGTGARRALLDHLSVHLACSVLLLTLFTTVPILRGITLLSLTILIAGHALLDLGKSRIIRRRPASDGWLLFVADQTAHVVVVIAAAALLPEVVYQAGSLTTAWQGVRNRVLVEAFVFATVVFPIGYLIRYLLAPLGKKLDGSEQSGLENAGLILGWIERALLLLAFSKGSFEAIALILGAKSVARFPDFKKRAFAEYFLIGTLLSISFAGLGAFVLKILRSLL